MFTNQKIKKLTKAITFSRGQDIYRMKDIKSFYTMDTSGNEGKVTEINAIVAGSRGGEYGVEISFDPSSNEILDSYCDCEAYHTYDGLCKHCVAVLLEYNDYEMRHRTIADFIDARNSGNKRGIGSVQKGMKLHTTKEVSELLKKKALAKSLPLLQQDTYGKVRIEASVECEKDIFVTFKIGVKKLYVLKDIFSFADAMNNQVNFAYGKNLRFIHEMQSFDEQSKPLVKFICKWAEENREKYQKNAYYGYSRFYYPPTAAKSKELKLTGRYIKEFFECLGNEPVFVNVFGMDGDMYQFAEGPIIQKVKITGGKDGIDVKLEESISYFSDGYSVYFNKGKIYVQSNSDIEPVADFIECMENLPNGTAFIEKSDVPAFCKNLLPSLEQYFDVVKSDFDEDIYGIITPEFKIYLDSPQENMITCTPKVCYGEKEFSIYTTEEIAIRDMEKEASMRQMMREFGNAFDENQKCIVAIDDEEVIYELMVEGIPKMQTVAEVFVSEALKRLEVRESPKVAVGVSISGNLMELTFSAGELKKEELLDILSKYNKKKKFYRLRDGSFVNAENSGLDTILELQEGLMLTDKQMKEENIEVPKYRALYLDAQLKEDHGISAMKDKAFRSLVRNMKTVEDNDFEIPKSLESTLREYQKTGFLWIKTLKHNGFGGILADDMGLGKTLQVICFLLSEQTESDNLAPTLIVAPASLVYNWKNEINHFAPSLQTKMVIGSLIERKSMIEDVNSGEILLTSYDLLRRDIELYKDMRFACEIIDEAQFIKNYNTQAAKAVKEIQADFKLALTGTPVENRLSELWSIFDYLMPGFLYTYKKFRDEIETPIITNGVETALRRLQKMIRPFVLRRLKKDVLTDLPDKLEENMYAKLDGEQQKLYDAHVQRMKILLDKQSDEEFQTAKIVILSELTKLRQICCDPALLFEDYNGDSAKLEMCISVLKNAVDSGHKILLFSQFTTMLERVGARLKVEGISYYTLTGATNKAKRAKMVEDFNKDETPVFLISLKAGGTGLNLTAADVVIHYDPWWNQAVQNQATDRAHRIGQQNVVTVYKMIVKNTIEENILKLQEKKSELADEILSGEGAGTANFTREELMELLQ